MAVNFVVEVPITRHEARRRGLARGVSKLVIYFETVPRGNKEEKEMEYFYAFLTRLPKNKQKLHAQPIGSYLHLDKYSPKLKENDIRHWFDEKFGVGKRRKPGLLTVECETEEKLRATFRIFQSDGIVFFLAEDYQSGGKLEETLLARTNWRVSLLKFRSGGYEEDYLKVINDYGLFVFFEDTKLSLEVLGRRDDILSAFSTALTVEKELPVEETPVARTTR